MGKLLKDRDRKKAKLTLDPDGKPGVFIEPEDVLIEELIDFAAFIKANQDCLKDATLNKPPEGDWFMADEEKDAFNYENIKIEVKTERKVIDAVSNVLSKMV